MARSGRAALQDFGGNGLIAVFVPSLINPSQILDLDADTSLLRWLATQGVRPMLVDWGEPGPADRDDDIDAHVTRLLLPMLRSIDEPFALAGYCLGGTIALAAAHLIATVGVAAIATPWRFAGFGQPAIAAIAELWHGARPGCETMGLIPAEILQTGFWRLDPERTIAKFERFAALPPQADAARTFVTLEDWANGGAPLTYAAGCQMFDEFFAADLPGTGRWNVSGHAIAPAALTCPMVEFVSANDRIVPAASAIGLRDSRVLAAGHVGMIVGSRARAQLWQPLADWLCGLSPLK